MLVVPATEENDQQTEKTQESATRKRTAWNKGKLIGPKPPLRPNHVWAIRTRLQLEGRARDLAMFNLAIDCKLRNNAVCRTSCSAAADGAIAPAMRSTRPV